jgi:hypothetical protein
MGWAEDVYINIAPSLNTREERLPSLELIVVKPEHVNGVALKASRVHKIALWIEKCYGVILGA